MEMERCQPGNSTVCQICDDANADVKLVSTLNGKRYLDGAWHISCVRERIENPNNSREERAMCNLMTMIREIPAKVA